jgi:histidinol-phosphate aminotransferase
MPDGQGERRAGERRRSDTPLSSPAAPPPPRVATRAAYERIPLYSPGPADAAPCAVDVSDNTNLWGSPPAALAAMREAPDDMATRYPAAYGATLKAAIARYAGARESEVVTGCGSDDVLDSAIRAFGEPGDVIAHPEPSFSMIPVFARMSGLEPVGVPLLGASRDYDVDADALLATGARIIYLCTPNNPTGTVTSRASVERVVERATGLVIIDEAYGEFAGDTFMGEAVRWGRVLVTRTLSKAFGLAGLRVGYGVASEHIVREVEKARGPYKVNGAAERAAAAALGSGLPWVREHATLAVQVRERLTSRLRGMGLRVLPSAGNFVLVESGRAPVLAAALRARGVQVRLFTDLPGIGDALRIGVGPWELMEQVLDGLREALG